MIIETTEHFIIVQLEDGDFKWVGWDYNRASESGYVPAKQPYKTAIASIKSQIPEQDLLTPEKWQKTKVWMITNTPEFMAIAHKIKKQLERDLGGGVVTPEKERK